MTNIQQIMVSIILGNKWPSVYKKQHVVIIVSGGVFDIIPPFHKNDKIVTF